MTVSSLSNDRTLNSFIPAIEGLRGVAIIGVLLFHLELPGCSLGWAGVELFFVISGFLITRILMVSRGRRNYFRNFYGRRSLRIFPLYYLVLIAYTVSRLLTTGSVPDSLFYYYSYLQTIPQLTSDFTDNPMLVHTWTLAIEEQFYLIWPALLLVLRGRALLYAIIFMIFGGLGLRLVMADLPDPYLILGWLGVQIDLFGAGALVAYLSQTTDPKLRSRWLCLAFLVGCASMAFLISRIGLAGFRTPNDWGVSKFGPFVMTAMAGVFAGVVGLADVRHGSTRWLELAPLRHCGKISYGIYLIHPFIFALVNVVASKNAIITDFVVDHGALTKIFLTYIVGWLSWVLIESPINRFKNRFFSQGEIKQPEATMPVASY